MTLKCNGWPRKIIGHLFYITSSFVHHLKPLGEFKLKLQPGNAQFGSKSAIPCPMWTWNLTNDLENNRAPLPCCFKLCASFHSHRWIQTKVTVRKRSIRVKFGDFLSRVTLKFDGWPWKTIGHLFYRTSSFGHDFVSIGEFKLKLQSGNPQFGSKSTIFEPCDLDIWRMTLKNNRAPLLRNIKFYVSFHHHMWIRPGVTVRKRLSWVMTSVTLTFDLWPWTFAWTSLLSLVITPEMFVMIRWWVHSQIGVTDRQTGRRTDGRTDRWTEPFIELLGRI